MYYLGVALNGDCIEFLLIDAQGRVHAVQDERHVDLIYDGSSSFRGIIESGIARVCLKANIRFCEINYTYFAVSDYGKNQDYDMCLEKNIGLIFKDNNFLCENDSEAAFIGALAGEPGITILIGAGSVVLGKNHKGESVRSGGWGHIAGDEAGEYWFAKKILEIFTKEADGRFSTNILYNIFRSKLDIYDDYEIINFSFENIEHYGLNFHEFVEILFEAANQGDYYAMAVIEEGSDEIFLHIQSIIEQIHFDDPIKVSYIGNLFQPKYKLIHYLENIIQTQIHDDISLERPKLSLVAGAALKALMFRRNITYHEIKELLEEEKRLHLLI